MHNRQIVPPDVEVECYSHWTADEGVPIYSGTTDDAFITIGPGVYPGSYVRSTQPNGPWSGVTEQVNIILIVTDDESFAVTTDQSYVGPMTLDTDPDGENG